MFSGKSVKMNDAPDQGTHIQGSHAQNSNANGIYVNVTQLLELRRLANTIDMSTRRRSTSSIDGSSRSSFRGRGMEFAEVRPYNAGDDIRNIDWRVTARTQQTYTKLFQEEKERPVYIVVDQRSTMFFASQGSFKSAFAAQVAAIIGWAALGNNDRIGALVFGDTQQIDLRAKRGKHALLQLVYQLQQYNHKLMQPMSSEPVQSLHEMLKDIGRVAKPGSAVFVISDFHDFDDTCKEPLAMASRHADVHLVHLYDNLEKTLPFAPNLLITDGKNKVDINSVDTHNYASQFTQLREQLQQFCLNRKITFTSTVNTTELSDLVSTLFAQKRNTKKQRG